MGLTKEEWHKKRVQEIIKYISEYGAKDGKMIVWRTYPICVKDICVDGALVKEDKTLSFGDFHNGIYKERKLPEELERTYLEDILDDMKRADGKSVVSRKVPAKKTYTARGSHK